MWTKCSLPLRQINYVGGSHWMSLLCGMTCVFCYYVEYIFFSFMNWTRFFFSSPYERMNTRKKALKFKPGPAARFNADASCRNLSKCHLGGVIFGCTNSTIKECLSKQLFGLYPPLNQDFFLLCFFSFLSCLYLHY